MAVTNGWGQASVNNTIDYGDGAIDNTINWGKVYASSASGDTNIGTSVTPSFSNVNSFDFDGTDETFIVNSASNYAFTGDFTIMAWVKIDSIGNNYYIIDTSSSASFGNGYSFRVRTDGKIRFWSYRAASTGLNGTTVLSAGTWYHIACVHNATHNTIYVNGVQDATLNHGGGHQTSDTSRLRIGSSQLLNGYTDGHIDEAAFFGSDLSSDINTIYNSGAPTDLSTYSPVGWFRMGDNATFTSGLNIWTMTSVGSTTNTAESRNMVEANRTTDVPT